MGSINVDDRVLTNKLDWHSKLLLYVCSETTTRDVIQTLLAKFHIQDNPRKFALYERLEDHEQGALLRWQIHRNARRATPFQKTFFYPVWIN